MTGDQPPGPSSLLPPTGHTPWGPSFKGRDGTVCECPLAARSCPQRPAARSAAAAPPAAPSQQALPRNNGQGDGGLGPIASSPCMGLTRKLEPTPEPLRLQHGTRGGCVPSATGASVKAPFEDKGFGSHGERVQESQPSLLESAARTKARREVRSQARLPRGRRGAQHPRGPAHTRPRAVWSCLHNFHGRKNLACEWGSAAPLGLWAPRGTPQPEFLWGWGGGGLLHGDPELHGVLGLGHAGPHQLDEEVGAEDPELGVAQLVQRVPARGRGVLSNAQNTRLPGHPSRVHRSSRPWGRGAKGAVTHRPPPLLTRRGQPVPRPRGGVAC